MNKQNDSEPTRGVASYSLLILLLTILCVYTGILLVTGYLEGTRALEFICKSQYHYLVECNR